MKFVPAIIMPKVNDGSIASVLNELLKPKGKSYKIQVEGVHRPAMQFTGLGFSEAYEILAQFFPDQKAVIRDEVTDKIIFIQ